MKICLDPGHGGSDPGAVGVKGARESALALLLARRIKEPLVAAGHSVCWTRTGETSLTLQQRVQTADREGAEVFISVHCNSAGKPDVRGVEWYHAAPDVASRALAERWERALKNIWPGLKSRGVRLDSLSNRGKLYVLRENYRRRPAVLLEAGFITNASDLEQMSSPSYGLALGHALVEALKGV